MPDLLTLEGVYVGLAFVAGYLTCWYTKLRPFARDVEATALHIRGILEEAEKNQK